MSHVSCLTSHGACRMSHASCLMFHVSRSMSHGRDSQSNTKSPASVYKRVRCTHRLWKFAFSEDVPLLCFRQHQSLVGQRDPKSEVLRCPSSPWKICRRFRSEFLAADSPGLHTMSARWSRVGANGQSLSSQQAVTSRHKAKNYR